MLINKQDAEDLNSVIFGGIQEFQNHAYPNV